MAMGRLIRISLITLGSIFTILAAFLLFFPIFSNAKVNGHPSLAMQALQAKIHEQRERVYLDPIRDGLDREDSASVEKAWKRYRRCSLYVENPYLRREIARLYVKKGQRKMAHEQVDKIIHPPVGASDKLALNAEMLRLWQSTGDTVNVSQGARLREVSPLNVDLKSN